MSGGRNYPETSPAATRNRSRPVWREGKPTAKVVSHASARTISAAILALDAALPLPDPEDDP
jgi:hypothetical protein